MLPTQKKQLVNLRCKIITLAVVALIFFFAATQLLFTDILTTLLPDNTVRWCVTAAFVAVAAFFVFFAWAKYRQTIYTEHKHKPMDEIITQIDKTQEGFGQTFAIIPTNPRHESGDKKRPVRKYARSWYDLLRD